MKFQASFNRFRDSLKFHLSDMFLRYVTAAQDSKVTSILSEFSF